MPSVGVWLSVEAITGRIADVRVNICFLLELVVRDCQQQVDAADTGLYLNAKALTVKLWSSDRPLSPAVPPSQVRWCDC